MSRRTAVTTLGALVVLHIALTFRYHVPLDDAFISFRYSHNLARGLGLVWNVGERVEGYTNFLWTVAIAPFLRLGLDPVPVATALGTLASAAVVLLTYRLARALGAGRGPALGAAAMTALYTPLLFAAGSGLETAAFTAALSGAVLLAARALGGDPGLTRWAVVGAALAVASLLRPEGALACAVTFAAAFLSSPASRRGSAALAAAYAAIVAPHVLWRFSYYGDWVPNTAHAKVGFRFTQLGRGLTYLHEWFAASGGALALLIPFAIGRRLRPALYLSALTATYLAYIVYVGGDALPMFRFALPVLPFLAALVAAGFERAIPAGGPRLAAGALAVSLATLPGLDPTPQSGYLSYADKRTEHLGLRRLGRWLGTHLPPGTSVATGVIGAIGYDSDLPLLDTFGLTDRHIARTPAGGLTADGFIGHEKGDGAYVLQEGPDVILPCELLRVTEQPLAGFPPDVAASLFRFKTEVELWQSGEFHRRYKLVSMPFEEGGFVNLYRRVD